MTTKIDVPSPLGFCAKHLSEAVRVPATTVVKGAAACDRCAVHAAGVDVPEMVLHRLGVADRGAAATAQPEVW